MLCAVLPEGQLMLPQSREVVLEYIVERKRMDDLAGSITDKRFHEQKVLYLSFTSHCRNYFLSPSLTSFFSLHVSVPTETLWSEAAHVSGGRVWGQDSSEAPSPLPGAGHLQHTGR